MIQDQSNLKEVPKQDHSDLSENKRLNGFTHLSPQDKLLVDLNRSGLEKLQLFTQMLRRSKMLDKVIPHHKLKI